MNRCAGCFKEGLTPFCVACRKRLFDGKNVAGILPFTRPTYNETKLHLTDQRISISASEPMLWF